MAPQFYPDTRFLLEALSDFLVCKIFILEGLQGIDFARFVRVDQVHDAEAALSEDSVDLILLADEIPLFVGCSRLQVLLRGWVGIVGQVTHVWSLLFPNFAMIQITRGITLTYACII